MMIYLPWCVSFVSAIAKGILMRMVAPGGFLMFWSIQLMGS